MTNRVHLDRAALLLEQGRANDAITELKLILQSEPDNDGAIALYARCCYIKKDFTQGIELLGSAIRLDPQNSYYFYLLGFGYYRNDKHSTALHYLNAAVSMNPYRAEYFGMLAHVYNAEKHFQLALTKANEGLRIDPENISCLNARSVAQNKLKMTSEAMETMLNALAQDPENEYTHLTVGWNLLEKGNRNDAATHFREALRINPNSENGRTGLKEALKAKIPPYKWLLSYSFWLHNKGKRTTRILPIAIFVFVRILASVISSIAAAYFFGAVIIGIYLLFVVTSWIINPIANFVLLFNKDGKYALTVTEKWTAISVVSCIATGLLFFILNFMLEKYGLDEPLVISALVCWGLAVSMGQVHFPISWNGHGTKNKIGLILALLGLITIACAFLYLPASYVTGMILCILLVLNTWLGVFK